MVAEFRHESGVSQPGGLGMGFRQVEMPGRHFEQGPWTGIATQRRGRGGLQQHDRAVICSQGIAGAARLDAEPLCQDPAQGVMGIGADQGAGHGSGLCGWSRSLRSSPTCRARPCTRILPIQRLHVTGREGSRPESRVISAPAAPPCHRRGSPGIKAETPAAAYALCILDAGMSDPLAPLPTAAEAPAPMAVNTTEAPAPVGPYNQAVRVGDLLFCSGQIALDPASGAMVGGGDVEAETRQVLANLRAVLAAGGSTPERVVRTTVFLADLADFGRVNALYAELFNGAVAPARACVQVAALPKGARVEIDAIAVVAG